MYLAVLEAAVVAGEGHEYDFAEIGDLGEEETGNALGKRQVSFQSAETQSIRVEEAAYIFVAVHAKRLDLLDWLHIVIVGLLPCAVGGGGDLVHLLAD